MTDVASRRVAARRVAFRGRMKEGETDGVYFARAFDPSAGRDCWRRQRDARGERAIARIQLVPR